MAFTADNVIVQQETHLWVAPVGTAMPADITAALDPAFKDVGYLNPDGITLETSSEKVDIEALQSLAPIKSFVTKREAKLSLGAIEFTGQNFSLAFPGKLTGAGGKYTFTPDETVDVNRAFILEVNEGKKKLRWLFPKAGQTGDVSFQITKQDAIAIPLELSVQNAGTGLFSFQTNMEVFKPGP